MDGNADIREVEQLLKESRYVMAVASLWDAIDGEKSGKVEKVYLYGFSNKKDYDRGFNDWNNGLECFFVRVRIEDGKVLGESYKGDVELDVCFVHNCSLKARRRRAREIYAGISGSVSE